MLIITDDFFFFLTTIFLSPQSQEPVSLIHYLDVIDIVNTLLAGVGFKTRQAVLFHLTCICKQTNNDHLIK